MAEIVLRLNPANTGHLLACYGVFEVAHRLTPEGSTKACFCKEDTEFSICETRYGLRDILKKLGDLKLKLDEHIEAVELQLPEGDTPLILDWWIGDDSLKTWAGQQKIAEIAQMLVQALRGYPDTLAVEEIFNWSTRFLNEKGGDASATAFDARLGRLTSIDVGFSMNVQKLKPLMYPAVEFFALIGIQRFMPTRDSGDSQWVCFTWSQPLSILTASLIGRGIWFVPMRKRTFSIRFRDDGKHYKALGPSQIVE